MSVFVPQMPKIKETVPKPRNLTPNYNETPLVTEASPKFDSHLEQGKHLFNRVAKKTSDLVEAFRPPINIAAGEGFLPQEVVGDILNNPTED